MRIRVRLLPALLACVGVLAIGTGSAAATVERYVLMHPGATTATSVGAVTFTASEFTVSCPITLRGELQADIPPSAGEAVGSITGASAGTCEGGAVAFLALPWPLTYSSLSGTQPEGMTAVLLTMSGVSARFTVLGGLATCLYSGEVGIDVPLTASNPYDVGTLVTLANTFTRVSGGFLCPATGSMSASFRLSPAQLLVEVAVLPLIASQPVITQAEAEVPGGKDVTFSPAVGDVTVTAGLWRDGANGWRTEILPCVRLIRFPEGSCTIRITAEQATKNQLRLLEVGGLAGAVAVGP